MRSLFDGARVGEDAFHLLGRIGQLAEQQANLVHAQLALGLRKQHGQKR